MLGVLRAAYLAVVFLALTLSYYVLVIGARLAERLSGRSWQGRATHQIAIWWARSIFCLNPWWRVHVQGRENLPAKGEPMVIVCNHQSNADILAMYYLGVQFRWLSKASVFKIPIIGQAMRFAGYVPIVRGNRESHIAALAESETKLRQGLSMFFFPEGTRSLTGEIKDFKGGAFKLACDANVPILPVAIEGAGSLLPKGSFLPRSSNIYIRVLPPLRGLPNESLEAFAERTRQQIIAASRELKSLQAP